MRYTNPRLLYFTLLTQDQLFRVITLCKWVTYTDLPPSNINCNCLNGGDTLWLESNHGLTESTARIMTMSPAAGLLTQRDRVQPKCS